jgi:hypothetical protein
VGVVRWLLDNGAAIDQSDSTRWTALWLACRVGQTPVVRLLLQRGADPTTAEPGGWTPLVAASSQGHLEVVRLLLGQPSARATLTCRDNVGRTALWEACQYGHGKVVRALLESGADATIADKYGTTPTAAAKADPPSFPLGTTAEGRRECVAALEVRFSFVYLITCASDQLSKAWVPGCLGVVAGRRRSGPTCSGRPGRWPTSRGPARWRWRGRGRGRGRRGKRRRRY